MDYDCYEDRKVTCKPSVWVRLVYLVYSGCAVESNLVESCCGAHSYLVFGVRIDAE